MLIVPWVAMKINPPQIKRTPEAAAFARRELHQMGRLSSHEWILAVVFVVVCTFWSISSKLGVDVAVPALFGSAALLITGVIDWEDVKGERAGWDIFIWYGGLLRLGIALNDAGVTTEFAKAVGSWFGGAGWITLFVAALLIFFYAHYAFASITAHLLAMYAPFLAVLFAKGAPHGLIVYAFACFANLAAGLTNYGTTPAPIFFSHGYTSMRQWWTVGFGGSLVNLAIWSIIGFTWWKLIGLW
jgi:DASS family divalent anion:Na+ symporter